MIRTVVILLCILLTGCHHAPDPKPVENSWATGPKRPTRLLVVAIAPISERTFAGAKPSDLRAHSVSFSRAYVGHLFAIASVSQLALETGKLPRKLPWQDRILFDTTAALGLRGRIYETGRLKETQVRKLVGPATQSSLFKKVKAKHGGPILAFSPEAAPADVLGLTSADHVIYTPDPSVLTTANLFLEASRKYPDWAATGISLSGPAETTSAAEARWLAEFDAGMEVILEELRRTRVLSETIIVVTGLHGLAKVTKTTANSRPPEEMAITGRGANFAHPTIPATLAAIHKDPNVEISVHDTALRFWLRKRDNATLAKLASALHQLPGAGEIYTKQKTENAYHYIRTFRAPASTGEQLEWAKEFHLTLAESIASESSPDALVLLNPGVSYGAAVETGGSQPEVQRIPLSIWASNLRVPEMEVPTEVRIVDINAIVSQLMGLPGEGLEGLTSAIEPFVINQ